MQKLFISFNDSQTNIRRADGVNISSACGLSTSALSASELLGAALGSCVAASLAPLFARHALDESTAQIVVELQAADLAHGLRVQLHVPACDENILLRLQRAAEQCSVRQALDIPVAFDWQVS